MYNQYMSHSNASNASVMEINGLKCTLNMPKAVERSFRQDGSEAEVSLPPYNPRTAFSVDEYETSPESWMRGSGKASSYFVPIKAEHGMWLDFQANSHHTHHVAALISVQGVNPLTGLKADPSCLEQYRDKCPKHNVTFEMNLYCPECKFNWHPQNYLSSNNGSPFWIDGFRTEDGVVRQWYFTEEECKGVASQILGKDRVFAIGVKFYLSKLPKPPQTNFYSYAVPMAGGGSGDIFGTTVSNIMSSGIRGSGSSSTKGLHSTNNASSWSMPEIRESRMMPIGPATRKSIRTRSDGDYNKVKETVKLTKQLEIGAGAKISQKINPDPEKLDFWQEEPAGMLYINYTDADTAQKIISAGKKLVNHEGFLAKLKIKDM